MCRPVGSPGYAATWLNVRQTLVASHVDRIPRHRRSSLRLRGSTTSWRLGRTEGCSRRLRQQPFEYPMNQLATCCDTVLFSTGTMPGIVVAPALLGEGAAQTAILQSAGGRLRPGSPELLYAVSSAAILGRHPRGPFREVNIHSRHTEPPVLSGDVGEDPAM